MIDGAFAVAHGHVIVSLKDDKEWRYADSGELYDPLVKPRTCPECNLEPYFCHECQDYHDGCLGHIKSANNACCGHGFEGHTYIQWKHEPKSLSKEATVLLNK